MVDNPAIHELNNIEVRGGDTDFQVVNIEGTSEDILLEYNDATEEWDIRGTVSDLDVADLEYEFGLHQTEINEDKEIPEGQGSVIAGPLTGTGEITGEGNLAVVDDVQDAVRNPVQENVDFNSNNATGISALEAGNLTTENSSVFAYPDQITIPHGIETKLPIDNVEFDQLDAVNFQDNKITVPTDGTYTISTVAGLRDSVDETFEVRVKVNGSDEILLRPLFGGDFTIGSFTTWPSINRDVELTAGDDVEFFMTQENSGENDAELYAGTRSRTVIRLRRV